MKILLLSDTHGDLQKAFQVYEKLTDIDLLLHCGDYQRDARTLEKSLKIPVISVKGNCDGADTPDRRVVETPAGRLLLTHGHLDGAGYNPLRLKYLAEENQCIAVCFGHTHIPLCEKTDDVYLINPGSLPRPRDGSNGSYAVIHSTEQNFYANIVYYDTVFGGKHGKDKPQSGFLRGLLNYSDRF